MPRRTRAEVEASMAARREKAAEAAHFESQIMAIAERAVAEQTDRLLNRAQEYKLDTETLNYLELAGQALEYRLESVERWITDICPECGDFVQEDQDDHSAIRMEDDTVTLLIGCEGAFILNPNVLGLPHPNWQDWAMENWAMEETIIPC